MCRYSGLLKFREVAFTVDNGSIAFFRRGFEPVRRKRRPRFSLLAQKHSLSTPKLFRTEVDSLAPLRPTTK
jgi:hypothetical protein